MHGPRSRRGPRWAGHAAVPYVAVGCIPFAIATVFLLMGAGNVLDDWFFRANAHFGGAFSVAGAHAGQRPGAVPLWALVFGPWGEHPLPSVLLAAAAGSTFAVCLALLLRQVIPSGISLAVAALWALLPTHTSLEAWLSCINIGWAQAIAAVGLVVGWRESRSWWHLAAAGACFLYATLAYEATIVVMMLAVVALPWVRTRRLDWPLVMVAVSSTGAGMAWVASHWFEGKEVSPELASVQDVFPANLAWAFFPPGPPAKALVVGALATVAFAGGRLLLPSFRAQSGLGERLIVVGAAVMVAGTAPFALYVYDPLGAGDRANGLSAVGGALVLAGVAELIARRSRPLVGIVAVGLLGVAMVTRFERLWVWHLAGRDADTIVAATLEKVPHPKGVVVVGPEPIGRLNVVAFLERTSIESALRLAYDDARIEADMAYSEEQFSATPPHRRVDMRPVSALDDYDPWAPG